MRLRSILLIVVLWTPAALAIDTNVRGHVSGWTAEFYARDAWQNRSGARYVPQIRLEQPLNDSMFLDLEAALNAFAAYDSGDDEIDADLALYRLTARLATNQTETRIGLQKLNFGPSRLLRALRWFDQLDQRDPQGLTDGVYGVLFRYTALNNANLRLWGLYGNDAVKGAERLPSRDDALEAGGRFQFPALSGEMAVTGHTRTVDGSALQTDDFRETRAALDGRWEYGVGFWAESVLQHQDADALPLPWMTMTTLGLDYTFGIGNGLYVVLEHMLTGLSDQAFGWDDDAHVSACMVSYPLGLFDSLSSISLYHWDAEAFSQHLSWQRAYDNLTIDASLFRYPELSETGAQAAERAGSGGQLMLMYYH